MFAVNYNLPSEDISSQDINSHAEQWGDVTFALQSLDERVNLLDCHLVAALLYIVTRCRGTIITKTHSVFGPLNSSKEFE